MTVRKPQSRMIFTIDPGRPPHCGARRGPRANTHCELPPGHAGEHLGRSRSGRWFSWRDPAGGPR